MAHHRDSVPSWPDPSGLDLSWPLPARGARRLLGLPLPLLERLAGIASADPLVVDGRVLDRRLQALLALGTRTGQTGGPRGDVAEVRQGMAMMSRAGMPVARGVHTADRVVDGPGGDLRVRTFRRVLPPVAPGPDGDGPPTILYMHGGGWVVGDLDSHDASCRIVAALTGCVVVSVEYRLAPEHPFPAAVDDCLAAYRWVHDHARDLAAAPGRIAVMGDSAGGNLAAVLAQQLRDAADVTPPLAQILVYPAVDTSFDYGSHRSCAATFGLDRDAMDWFLDHYFATEADRLDPRAAPIRSDDLSGLAPALVITAGFDPLRDEGRAYADALAEAGVAVRHRCYDDMIHGFFGMGSHPEVLGLITEICALTAELIAGAVTSDRSGVPA